VYISIVARKNNFMFKKLDKALNTDFGIKNEGQDCKIVPVEGVDNCGMRDGE
jgi:hypothetical protein